MNLPEADVYIVALSGGRDSTALAVWAVHEGLDCYYIFCDTKAEYPEVYDYLRKIEEVLSLKIIRIESEGFETILKKKNYYWPGPKHRWCTQLLKIKPMQNWLKQFGDAKICTLVGSRVDERRMRPLKKIGSAGELRVFPFLDLGFGIQKVKRLLIQSGIGEPIYYNFKRRSGCWCCPFQSVMAWRNLLRYHPELFAKAEEWQAEIDKRFETGKQREPFHLPYLQRLPLSRIREIEESQYRMIELVGE
jgi:3'-phosphoadenosine 5'-phosphosulfate sulfotransferase (PAPS reductase)/FAD synthetase